jgi:hypothetical protein
MFSLFSRLYKNSHSKPNPSVWRPSQSIRESKSVCAIHILEVSKFHRPNLSDIGFLVNTVLQSDGLFNLLTFHRSFPLFNLSVASGEPLASTGTHTIRGYVTEPAFNASPENGSINIDKPGLANRFTDSDLNVSTFPILYTVTISDCAIPSHNYDARLSEDELLCRFDRPPRPSPPIRSLTVPSHSMRVRIQKSTDLSNFRLLCSHRILEIEIEDPLPQIAHRWARDS